MLFEDGADLEAAVHFLSAGIPAFSLLDLAAAVKELGLTPASLKVPVQEDELERLRLLQEHMVGCLVKMHVEGLWVTN